MLNLLRVVLRKKRLIIKLFVLGWVIITLYLGIHYWNSTKQSQTSKEVAELKQKLSRHVILDGPDPGIVTVTDSEKLKSADPFYKRAQNGDKIIIWEEKALIYRPSTDRIVDFGIVLRQPVSPTPQTTQNRSAHASILLLNGTKKNGLASTIKQKIQKESSINDLISAYKLGDAQSKEYTKTVLIDNSSGKFLPLTKQLARILKATVTTLPDSENQDLEQDIIIILGESPSP